MSMNEIEAKIRELRQLQALIEEAQAEAEAIKDAVKAQISENLGHSDKSVTLRMYTHADKESWKRASDIVRDRIKEDPPQDAEKQNAG